MYPLQLIAGTDIPVKALGVSLHQPTILEISYIGTSEYFSAMQLLSINKNMLVAEDSKGTSNLLNKNNFEIFMTLINGPDATEQKNNVLSTLTLLFPKYQPQFLPRSIYFNDATTGHNFMIDERTFDELRGIIRAIAVFDKDSNGSGGSYNPAGPKAAEIAAKLMKGRARAQGAVNGNGDMLTRYVSILTVALPSMSLKDCLNLTVFQLCDLMERYNLYTSWDLDIRSRLAGGKPENKPDDWTKNIH